MPGGSVGAGGVLLDANDRPILGDDGGTLTADPIGDARVPPGGSVGAGGVILDDFGKPLIGADGAPLVLAGAHPSVGGGVIENGDGDGADDDPDTMEDIDQALVHSHTGADMQHARKKQHRHSEIVPAGCLITFSRLRAKEVPDMDIRARSQVHRRADPYLIIHALDASGAPVDEVRTSHIDNTRNPMWRDTLRLFVPEDNVSAGSLTPSTHVLLTLMDKNKKKADAMIGEVKVDLSAGSGEISIEVPSRHPSSMKPHVFFSFEASPQMFYEQEECNRVAAKEGAHA